MRAYASAPSFVGISPGRVVAENLLPTGTEVHGPTSEPVISTAFGGRLLIDAATIEGQAGRGAALTFTDVPKRMCGQFVANTGNYGFDSITINSQDVLDAHGKLQEYVVASTATARVRAQPPKLAQPLRRALRPRPARQHKRKRLRAPHQPDPRFGQLGQPQAHLSAPGPTVDRHQDGAHPTHPSALGRPPQRGLGLHQGLVRTVAPQLRRLARCGRTAPRIALQAIRARTPGKSSAISRAQVLTTALPAPRAFLRPHGALHGPMAAGRAIPGTGTTRVRSPEPAGGGRCPHTMLPTSAAWMVSTSRTAAPALAVPPAGAMLGEAPGEVKALSPLALI